MPRKTPNFFDQVKEKGRKKVEDKVKEKQEASEPYNLGDKDVHDVDGVAVFRPDGMMPTWVQGGAKYHLNTKNSVRDGVHHVTLEQSPKIHYWFQSTDGGLVSIQPTKQERSSISGTSETLKDLPSEVRDFVSEHWLEILGS